MITPNEKIDDKIIRTFSRIQTPLLENIEVNYGKNKLIDEIREEKCLFNYEFYNVFAKLEKLEDDIELKGKILDKEYIWRISKEDINATEVDLEILFAKIEIDRLEEYIRNVYLDDEKEQNYKNMIIEIATKYNINSKYTSFITVYERENKILEVPIYQETVLSDRFAKRGIMNRMFDMFAVDEDYEEYDYDMEEKALASKSERSNLNDDEDMVLPRFLKRHSDSFDDYTEKNDEGIPETDIEILQEKVNTYYKEFIDNQNKNISTYLLYLIYSVKNKQIEFDYDKFLEFINSNKHAMETEEYKELLYLCYVELRGAHEIIRYDILNILGEKYRKLVYANCKLNVERKKLSQEDIKDIIEKDEIIKNIDDILWYLYSYESEVIVPSWLWN